MIITRDQFIRGFNALKADKTRRDAIETVADRLGLSGFDMGCNPVATELEQQLVERCRDKEDDSGPWPEESCGEGDIALALHYFDVAIYDENDKRQPNLTTAEEVWDHWETTKTGPFRQAVIT